METIFDYIKEELLIEQELLQELNVRGALKTLRKPKAKRDYERAMKSMMGGKDTLKFEKTMAKRKRKQYVKGMKSVMGGKSNLKAEKKMARKEKATKFMKALKGD